MAARTKSEYLTTIDGWRAIAIAAVLLCHRQTELFGTGGIWPNSVLKRVADEGGHGVDLFFAISGLLITRRLLAEVTERGTPSLTGFYVRRAFRILPAVATYLTLVSIIALAGKWDGTRNDLIASLFFYRNYVPGNLLTQHLWSLAVEEHFYLIWPLFFLALLKWGRGKIAIWPIITLALGVAVWRFVYFAGNVVQPSMFDPDPTFRTDVRFDALLWGCVAALVLDRTAVCAKLDRWLSAPLVLLMAIAYGASGLLPFAPATWAKALLGPLLLVSTMRHPHWAFSRFLESRAIRWVGHLSYSLYLFQQAVVATARTDALGLLSFLPACFALAALCYYVVEKPLVRLGHRVSARLAGGNVPTRARFRELATLVVVGGVFVTTYAFALRATPPLAHAPDAAEVQLFADANFRGASIVLGPGTHGPNDLGVVGSDVSSIIVGRRARARVCGDAANDVGLAKCVDLAPGTLSVYVGDELNDKISTVEVTAR